MPVETAKFTLPTEVMLVLRKTLVTCVRFSDVRPADEELLDELLLLDAPLLVPDFVSVVPDLPEAVSRSPGLVVSPVLLEAPSLSVGLVVSPVLLEAASLSAGFPAAAGLLPLPTVP